MQLRASLLACVCVCVVGALTGVATAAPAVKPTRIAIAPLSTLGAEDTSAAAKKLESDLARELTAASGAKVVFGTDVTDEIKKAKKPILRACDGDTACLTELGKLMGASHVVFGEVGGLGDVQVIYLVIVDVSTGKELRRTQVQMAAVAEGGVKGGAMRLVDPDRFTGKLVVTTPVKDAVIYVDGRRVGKSPAPAVSLPVGAHALRVTHPEHRDFVRFVEIAFDKETPVAVELSPYASIDTELGATDPGAPKPNVTYIDGKPKWYRQWWAIAGFGAVALTGAVIIGVTTADGVDFDASGTVKPPQ
jgi:hypothetical protein